ncbi:hypothetical protein L9F63_023653, partial [Diploptera punctata]
YLYDRRKNLHGVVMKAVSIEVRVNNYFYSYIQIDGSELRNINNDGKEFVSPYNTLFTSRINFSPGFLASIFFTFLTKRVIAAAFSTLEVI